MNVKHHTKKLLAVALTTLFASSGALAQNEVKGTTYYLPQTAIQFSVLVERTATQPGDLCMYSERFLKKSDVAMKPTTQYRILDITARATGVRDTSKMYTANINSKHSIVTLKVNEDGIIDIKSGIHPLLDRKTAVPIDLRLGEDCTLLIVTGPNTGGKTV